MFKNLVIYKMNDGFTVDEQSLQDSVEACKFTPCANGDIKKSGWVPSLKGSDQLVYSAQGQILMTILTEEKMLPSSVIKEEVAKKVENFEERHGKKAKKKDKDTFKDEVIQEILPRAFSKYSNTLIWVCNKEGLVFVDTGSAKKAEDALALLRKTLGSLPVTPFAVETPVEVTMTEWLKDEKALTGFAILDEAELTSVIEGGVLTSKKENLFSEEIRYHIEAGKRVTKISLDWQERLSFTLTDELILKKIKFSKEVTEKNSDIDKEDKAGRFDADFVLFTGDILEMFKDLCETLNATDVENS